MDIADVGTRVLSADGWEMKGLGRTRFHDAMLTKRLIAVHRGWYVDAAEWKTWRTEERHAAKTIATARSMRGGDVVLSHTSAAVVHSLPLYRVEPLRVHLIGPRTSGSVRDSASVARHTAHLRDDDIVVVDGISVTSLARTVADLVGRLPLRSAVALADAAMRDTAWRGGADPYDETAAEAFRENALECAPLRAGARGSVQGRWVLGFADGRAHLPGESVSRLYLHQLGFAPPRLQVRVAHAKGHYDVDFGLDDVDMWGEFDGTGKYTDPEMLRGATSAEVVMREKYREDDLRGTTQRGMIRWGSSHIDTLETFRARLAEFHIHAPGRPGDIPPTFRGPKL